MQIQIVADSAETVKIEILKYLTHRSEQIRGLINITGNITEKRSYQIQSDAILRMVEELLSIPIMDLSQPQDFDTIEQMEDAAKARLGKSIHVKSNDPWFQLSVILYKDSDEGFYYDFGPNVTVTRAEAEKRLEEIKRKRDTPKDPR